MKRIYTYVCLFFIISIQYLGAQQTANSAGTTPGSLSVSLTGAATYSVPIEVPKGTKGVQPNLALSYSSQGGNGLAGWGWNVSGLSTITRVGATQIHNGFIDPVDFDDNDQYALDGQRLVLVSGNHGKRGAIYATENFSNLKIVCTAASSYNVNPSQFKVFYPDGSIATYGGLSTTALGKLEWAISKWEDPQGNYISYYYKQDNDLLRIDNIIYGSRLSQNFKIEFSFKDRARWELAYMGGEAFVRSKILNEIRVMSGSIVLRRFDIGHDLNELQYDIVSYIQESNNQGEYLPPLTFEYNTTQNEIHVYGSSVNAPDWFELDPEYSREKHVLSSGEFNGAGSLDLLMYDKTDKTEVSVFEDININSRNNTATTIDTGKFTHVLSGQTLSQSNQVLDRQSIVTVDQQQGVTNASSLPVSFKIFNLNHNSYQLEYQKQWNLPTSEQGSAFSNEILRYSIPKNFISGDFNGDGLMDVIAYTYTHTNRYCRIVDCSHDDINFREREKSNVTSRVIDTTPRDVCRTCEDVRVSTPKTYFFDLNRNNSNTSLVEAGNLRHEIKSSDLVLTVDFDGDGKTDIVHFSNEKLYVYSLNDNSRMILIYDQEIKRNDDFPILQGDFNGDGKWDFTIPKANNSDQWTFYYSTGENLAGYTRNTGITFKKSTVVDDYLIYERYYVPQDFNGDGKTDILFQENIINGKSNAASQTYNLFHNISSSLTTKFLKTTKSTGSGIFLEPGGTPIIGDYTFRNGNPEYLFIAGKEAQSVQFLKDNRIDMTLKAVSNGRLSSELTYDRITTEGDFYYDGDVYSPYNNMEYPMVNINKAPSFMMIKKITEKGSGITRHQDFRYGGAVSHLQGLGFLGFQEIHRSNWYGDGVSQLWNSSKYDPNMRGAIIKEWVANHKSSSPYNHISEISYSYDTQISQGGVFINLPERTTTKDLLTGVTTTRTIQEYDGYNNPKKIFTLNSAGSTLEQMEYYNNASATNNTYHVGRIKRKSSISTISGNSFHSEESFVYNNNLITSIKRKGNGSEIITLSYQHDTYGNITSKTISTYDGLTRTESYSYGNTNGRFIRFQTDIEGFTTEYKRDLWGNVLETKDRFGNTTVTIYDGWNRIDETRDYLGNTTHFNYRLNSNGFFETSINYPQSQDEVTVVNAFGWQTRVLTMSLNGRYVYRDFKYDAQGRQTHESEPSFGTPNQWNRTIYDQYGRVYSQQLYTGKIISMQYNGLSITADDGNRTVKTTKDARGNTVKLEDNGGTITYTYFGNGHLKTTTYDGQTIRTEIDQWGRRKKLIDPSAGTYEYLYNGFGEVTTEISPKGITTYEYDSYGKIEFQSIKGDETDLVMDYHYDSKQLLQYIIGEDKLNNRSYDYEYEYDNKGRTISVSEDNSFGVFHHLMNYDGFGRIFNEEYKARDVASGFESSFSINNYYDSHSGLLEEIKNATNQTSLWKINSHDARGQLTQASLGNGHVISNEYDSYGLPKRIKAYKNGTRPITALDMEYQFNAARGILESRENNNLNWQESFAHDDMDRLTTISGSVTRNQFYNLNGTISDNSILGAYVYSNTSKYQIASIDLNESGQAFYKNRAHQHVVYNTFKKPVEIFEQNRGRVSFEYGILGNRTSSWYGGLDEDKNDRRYQKIYSSIIPVEIYKDTEHNRIKIITYIGGDAYTAPMAHIHTNQSNMIDGMVYLHRDYLGSILAISNENGGLEEQRQYGAWGRVDRFKKSSKDSVFDHNSILNRGYTGHEHFFEVSLIHMNGRLYDAQLARFLSPDNFVQDPYNTQNFNRYGYVLNNPLVNADPSGEIIMAALVGAAIGAITAAISGGDFGDILLGAIIGGATAIAGFGASNLALGQSFFSGSLVTTGFGAGFSSGFAAGFASTFVASSIAKIRDGEHVMDAIFGGINEGLKNGFVSGLVRGIFSGIKAVRKGLDFFSGEESPVNLNRLSLNTSNKINLKPSIIVEGDYHSWTGTSAVPNSDSVFRLGRANVTFTYRITEKVFDLGTTLIMNGRDWQEWGDNLQYFGSGITVLGLPEIGKPINGFGGIVGFGGATMESIGSGDYSIMGKSAVSYSVGFLVGRWGDNNPYVTEWQAAVYGDMWSYMTSATLGGID